MNDNQGGLMGRITALALILGVAFGVRAIANGGMGCPLGNGACCLMTSPHHDEHGQDHVDAAPAADSPLADPDAPKNIPAPVPSK